ncbi:Uncharacterised protein [Mycobacteroides abscessus subsp. abscessus]|nr:Uncharacterised protein [Mycobacteroides abscessus subsp. abscessus]SIL88829.1 Uncharacterised protein [Mycobacteroides abscessus subsp. abscessus]
MAFFAPKLGLLLLGGRRYLATHMLAEEVPDPLSFAQALHHGVETGLQLAELGAVVDDEIDVEVILGDPLDRGLDFLHRRSHQP